MKQQEENRIWDYVDGFLDTSERLEVETWLQSDAQARQLLAEITQLKARLYELPAEKPSAGFTMNVLGAFDAENGNVRLIKSNSDFWIIKSIAAAFIGIILLLTGVMIYFGAGHEVRHVSEGLANSGAGNVVHFLGNKIVSRSLLIAEVLVLLFLAEKFLKTFTLKKA